MRDLGPGSAKGGVLVVDGDARRLHGSFVGLSWCVARIVIGDLDVDATVDGALELVEDRRICEFVSRDAKAVAGRSPPDVSQACFEQAAREPNNLGVRRIVDVLGRSISKLLGELLARDRTAIEPNAVACAFFPLFLRLDLEPQLVLRVAGECAGLSVPVPQRSRPTGNFGSESPWFRSAVTCADRSDRARSWDRERLT